MVTYDSDNHRRMVELRARKIARIADNLPAAAVDGESEGDLLVVGWGSTYGAVVGGVRQARDEGYKVSHLHLRHLHPLPRGVGEALRRFRRVLVPENNLGQLNALLRSQFLVDTISLPKVEGRPFLIREIRNAVEQTIRQ